MSKEIEKEYKSSMGQTVDLPTGHRPEITTSVVGKIAEQTKDLVVGKSRYIYLWRGI